MSCNAFAVEADARKAFAGLSMYVYMYVSQQAYLHTHLGGEAFSHTQVETEKLQRCNA